MSHLNGRIWGRVLLVGCRTLLKTLARSDAQPRYRSHFALAPKSVCDCYTQVMSLESGISREGAPSCRSAGRAVTCQLLARAAGRGQACSRVSRSRQTHSCLCQSWIGELLHVHITCLWPASVHVGPALPLPLPLYRALQFVARGTAGLLLSRLHLQGSCFHVMAAPLLATPSSLSLSIEYPASCTVSGADHLQVPPPHPFLFMSCSNLA